MDARFIVPPLVTPGAKIAIIAPSSPFPESDLQGAVRLFEREFVVQVRGDIGERDGYLAGSDDRRLRELQDALDDHSVRAIVAIRGGFGAGRIVARLDAARFRAHPKWILGFSDITVLHLWAHVNGVASVHGPNAGTMGRVRAESGPVIELLRHGCAGRQWAVEGAAPFEPVEGVALGGNLTVLAHEAIAGRLPRMTGAVLFLEDVGERAYRIDRMLSALADGGAFDGLRALVFGSFARCDAGEGGEGSRSVAQIIRGLAMRLGVPVVHSAPFGHADPNEYFVQGTRVTVSMNTVRFQDVTSGA